MARLSVTEHEGSVFESQENNFVDLPETRGFDVRLGVSRDEIEGMSRRGDDLIITLENGEIITLEDFFVATADEVPHRLFTEEAGGFLPLGLAEGAAVADAAGAGVGALGVLGGLAGLALAAGGASGGESTAGVASELASNIDDVDDDGDINDVLEGTDEADELRGFGGDDTITGLEGDDILIGGAGNDNIDGGDNNDVINGDAGMDILNGNDGEDTISGGNNDDLIDGGLSDDELSGDAGNDTINGDNGDDIISGGSGDDTLSGNNGEDTIFGGDDNDLLVGGASNDVLSGDAGNDTLFGSNGDDTISGGDGIDTINGGGNDDVISGGTDNDTLNGNSGNDTLNGDAGDDLLDGGNDSDLFIVEDNAGNDTIIGGEGGTDEDVLDLTAATEDVTVQFTGAESGTVTVGDDTIVFEEIETVLALEPTPLDFSNVQGLSSGSETVLNSLTLNAEPFDVTLAVNNNPVGDTFEGDSNGNVVLSDGEGDIPDEGDGTDLTLDFGSVETVVTVTVPIHDTFIRTFNIREDNMTGDRVTLEAEGGFTVDDPDGQLNILTNDGDTLVFEPAPGFSSAHADPTFTIATSEPVSRININGDGDPSLPISFAVDADAEIEFVESSGSSAAQVNFALIEEQDPSELETIESSEAADGILDDLALELSALNLPVSTVDLGGDEEGSQPSTASAQGSAVQDTFAGIDSAANVFEEVDVVI